MAGPKIMLIAQAMPKVTGIIAVLLGTLACSPSAQAASKNGFDLDGALIPSKEIRKGGPPRDGIPSLDDPQFVAGREADFLAADDRILGLTYQGVSRAYPIRILNYHEIVNDSLNGQSVVVTYCPLCGTGVAFSATPIGDRRLEFGVSGLLYNSDVLMYDRQTGSLWSQLMNLAISGPLKGAMLESLAISHTTWRDWLDRFPDTEVLTTKTGFRRNYSVNPYPGYSGTGKLYFPVSDDDNRYRRKEVVMGVQIRDQFRAYPFEELRQGPAVFADEFQGESFEVLFDADNETARLMRKDGSEIPTILSFWFAWYAFHPKTEVFTAGELFD